MAGFVSGASKQLLLQLVLLLALLPPQPLRLAGGLSLPAPISSLRRFSRTPWRRHGEVSAALLGSSVSCLAARAGAAPLQDFSWSKQRRKADQKGGRARGVRGARGARGREREERSASLSGISPPVREGNSGGLSLSAADGNMLWRGEYGREQQGRNRRRRKGRFSERKAISSPFRPWQWPPSWGIGEGDEADPRRRPALPRAMALRDEAAFLSCGCTPCYRRPCISTLCRAAFSPCSLSPLSSLLKPSASSLPRSTSQSLPSSVVSDFSLSRPLPRSSSPLPSIRQGVLSPCGVLEGVSSCSKTLRSPSSPCRRPSDASSVSPRLRLHASPASLSFASSSLPFCLSSTVSLRPPLSLCSSGSCSSLSPSSSSPPFLAPSNSPFLSSSSSPSSSSARSVSSFSSDSPRCASFPSSSFSASSSTSSRLNATHQDLPGLAPPASDTVSSPATAEPAFLSVEVDNFEPSPEYRPPRLPLPMQTVQPHASALRLARAEARFQRLSPIKTRRVLAEIKGMSLGRALAHLATSPRRPAFQVFKTIQSALANAIHAYGAQTLQPRIQSITAQNGPVMKRPFFRARGRMDIRRRPTTHIRVVLQV
ncbi:ribosomal protein RPL22 [Toxoplasma gondii RUB]|uniref:Large ribosomal subunit protein uL22c n=2 Tax=Toxoplasma gondii TaxID=5811 RepID=A0A086MB69_TOXGO|nr:ribosomal protein RPL22 [Toxoplasma gondii p89]KFG66137.1 ribosomal protein RPL22 [Toxoplasma gondii RUB]